MNALLNKLFPSPSGGSTEAAIGYEGISWGWAFFLFLVLGVAIWWLYRWGAGDLSRKQRGLLTTLRLALVAVFLFLLVKPVLLLTLNEPVRERLLVLVDTTQSMQIKDHRVSNEDLNRAAIAAGLISPTSGITGGPPSGIDPWVNVSRGDLLKALAGNDTLKLWPRLQERADLEFYRFGRDAKKLGGMGSGVSASDPISIADAQGFFDGLKYDDDVTAIGDSLRQVLEDNRGQPVAGVLVVSDGANNTGTPPEEIADLAKQDGVPIFLYGVGIVGPKDIIVRELAGPRGAFIKERAEFTVKVRAPGYTGRMAKIVLKADGKTVDEQEVKLNGDGETEYRLGYEPQEKAEVKMEASIAPVDGESEKTNNTATTKVRVLDSQVKVLYIEQEPRWDFRYLLATLQRDRRLSVKCVLLDGGDDLGDEPDSPFLPGFPTNRADVVANEIIIIGDVDPQALGDANMKLINEWVSDLGGGLIFLAGPKNDPFHYAGTPLEPLLPVKLDTGLSEDQITERSREPILLKLTTMGEYSPLLRLSDDTLENRQIWNSFPGVRWTARVAGARPMAQVFLVDTNTDHAVAGEPNPVLAQQTYGQGAVMYFGFDETYRWRSHLGEKFYSKIWNQIIQNFSLERQLGASTRTQLKVDRPEYMVGEKVIISGKLFTQSFAPLKEATVPGTLVFKAAGEGTKDEPSELRLIEVPDQQGNYQAEFTPRAAGEYRFSTLMDPKAILKFNVVPPKLEQAETAMDASLLQAMADASGGKFLREENLNELPKLVSSRSATVPTFKKRELFYSPWWMVVLVGLAAAEWLFRRLWQLK
ncbi:MAG: hypothetical protein ACREKL_13555 [Chthoniobacterales bacterium]